jgi:phage-related baseplate assembly protein
LERLQGAKPYALARFSLLKVQDEPLLIPKDFELTDTTGIYKAKTIEAKTIEAGSEYVDIKIELQKEIKELNIKTEIPINPLPFLKITQLEFFKNGGDKESDEEFKERIKLSFADKSTAGAKQTYISFALRADERIDDVSVRSAVKKPEDYLELFQNKSNDELLEAIRSFMSDFATVEIFFYSKDTDEVMKQRIEETLNDEKIRPLTDKIRVLPAQKRVVDISATLYIEKKANTQIVLDEAKKAIEKLFQKPKIGKNLYIKQLIKALMVEGVNNVEITTPATDLIINEEEIAVLGEVSLGLQEDSDEY